MQFKYKIFRAKAFLKVVFSSSRALMLPYGDSMSFAINANSGNISSNYRDRKTKVRLIQPDH